MKITLYGNGSSGNHGCEAIVRGTVALLDTSHTYLIQSQCAEEDKKYHLDDLAQIQNAKSELPKGPSFLAAYAKLKLTKNYTDLDGLAYLPSIKSLQDVDYALSVGGDNYCYGNPDLYAYLNHAYHKQCIKTILWGCSIEPNIVKQSRVAKDLCRYNHIVARESITYNAIRSITDHVTLAPDPAFFMSPAKCDIDLRFSHKPIIGVNISPMVISAENSSGMVYQNYCQLIKYILHETDAYIALIPHVVWDRNDDRVVLQNLYDDFNHNERLILIGDHSAPELKYIISKCDFFIGARTHATIAAYSTCVPTLAIGYSVKARGIARDLFGTDDGYVVPVQALHSNDDLTLTFSKLWVQAARIRSHLNKILPDYLSAATNLYNIFEDLT